MAISHGQPGLLAMAWILGLAGIVVVSLRVIAKTKIRRFRLDDMVMIFALCLGLVASALLTSAIVYGYDQQTIDVIGMDATIARKYYSFTTAFIVACAATARAAFVLYLLAILGTKKWQRIILIVLTGLEIAVNAVTIILLFASCRPVRAVWDYDVEADCLPDSIQIKYGIFQSTFNAAVDLYLAVMPTYIFWHLNLALPVKLTLVGLMSLALLAMGASIGKAIQLPDLQEELVTGTTNIIRWGFVEAYMVIIVASLPCLRSLIISSFRSFSSSRKRSQSQSHNYELGPTVGTTSGAPSLSAATARASPGRTDGRSRNPLPKPDSIADASFDQLDPLFERMSSVEATEPSESTQHLGTAIRKDMDFELADHKIERVGVGV